MKKFLKQYSLIICNVLFFAYCINLFLVNYFNISTNHSIYLRISLIPSLLIYITATSKKNSHVELKWIVFCSLALAWIADLFLLNDNSYGIHINLFLLAASTGFFIFFISKLADVNFKGKGLAYMIFTTIGFVVIYLNFYKWIDNEFNDQTLVFKLAIVLYLLSLAFGGILVANLCANKQRKQLGITFFLPGILLFSFSTLLNLGLKLKNIDFDFMQLLIVFTLYFGHYYVAKGYAKYLSGL